MSTFELLDELEAGELAIRFEGEEPQALLEWAIAQLARASRFGGVPGRRVRADRHGVRDRPSIRVFTVDTGRLPTRRSS